MDSSKVYLTQTDTTVGFLSGDDKKLALIKQRSVSKKTLQVVSSFKKLQHKTRVPKRFRKLIRNSKLTSFIYPKGLAFRVVPNNSTHHSFIKKFDCLYSTSANKTGDDYDENFAKNNSDIIVYNQSDFQQNNSSKIYKITKQKLRKIR
ncbi:MAG: Sua5 YciO YrdC YwlC family protein [Campylobacterota bacterium]|nr:Sua5 YciO YrdC YwlC family protein [Campylobacterota bacterium]